MRRVFVRACGCMHIWWMCALLLPSMVSFVRAAFFSAQALLSALLISFFALAYAGIRM